MTVELRLTHTLPGPAERVWRALTDPAALAAWFWPDRFATTAEVDPRVGGGYRIDGSAGGIAVTGRYPEIARPHRLAFTWQWAGDPDETVVTIELTPTGEGTALLLRHGGFASDVDRDNHVEGWSECLGRLPAWLASAAP